MSDASIPDVPMVDFVDALFESGKLDPEPAPVAPPWVALMQALADQAERGRHA